MGDASASIRSEAPFPPRKQRWNEQRSDAIRAASIAAPSSRTLGNRRHAPGSISQTAVIDLGAKSAADMTFDRIRAGVEVEVKTFSSNASIHEQHSPFGSAWSSKLIFLLLQIRHLPAARHDPAGKSISRSPALIRVIVFGDRRQPSATTRQQLSEPANGGQNVVCSGF
jgi:hypothetical protein